MKLDSAFSREIKKIANGDGSREAKFVFRKKVEAAKKELSTPEVRRAFGECLQKYGRVPVAICTAVTIIERRDRLEACTIRWATEVLKLWTNRSFSNLLFAYIDDGLHPSRIEEYAGAIAQTRPQRKGMRRVLKRIRPESGSPAFWIRKRGNTFIAYMTFINAVLGIASPSLMCMYAGGLKQAYEEGKI